MLLGTTQKIIKLLAQASEKNLIYPQLGIATMQTKVAAMIGILVLAVGMSGLAIFPSIISQPSDLQATETGHMLGHVTLIHKDSKGNIVQYLQGDNVVVNHGDDCAIAFLIAGTTPSSNQCGTVAAGFADIGLGNSTTAAAKTDVKLGAEISSNVGNCCGLGRAAATTTTFTQSAANGNNGGKVVLSKTFTSTVTNAVGIAISEAGLFNSTIQAAFPMTAHQVFPTLTLANGDTLAVTWTITLN